MRLSLGGWPPVASHATCLLAGLALAHLTIGERQDGPRFPAQFLIFSLSVKTPLLDESKKGLRLGTKLALIKSSSNGSCRLHDTSLDLLAVEPNLLLALPLRDPKISTVVEFLQQKNLQKVGSDLRRPEGEIPFLETASKAQRMPLCQPAPRVIYD